jgi:nucleoid-associated protein YejK
LFGLRIIRLFIGTLHAQEALVAQAQHVTLLRIAHLHPAKAFLAAAQATTAKTAFIGLANATTRAGNVKKLKLLRHTSSCVLKLIEDAIAAAGK